jgi:hypothetical protein
VIQQLTRQREHEHQVLSTEVLVGLKPTFPVPTTLPDLPAAQMVKSHQSE